MCDQRSSALFSSHSNRGYARHVVEIPVQGLRFTRRFKVYEEGWASRGDNGVGVESAKHAS